MSNGFVFVVFGATGDLFNRKLAPAFYKLFENHSLDSHFAIIGFARKQKTLDDFRREFVSAVKAVHRFAKEDVLEKLVQHIYYNPSDFEEDAGYESLQKTLSELDSKFEANQNRVFYLATLPNQFEKILKKIKRHGLAKTTGFCRLVVEKPFGFDLKNASKLNRQLQTVFSEDQIFRIDHYLGKELVQNIITTRFANDFFRFLWNRHFIDHVQVLVAEENGIGNRANYYDSAGVLRDMLQNHLLQLVALTAMDCPQSLLAQDIAKEKIKILKKIHVSNPPVVDRLVLGQYDTGVMDGEPVVGYQNEKNVPPHSLTPTFCALKLEINSKAWKGVPFFVRSGKRLAKSTARIWVHFKQKPSKLFENTESPVMPNRLEFRIQPDEGIALSFNVKVPGRKLTIKPYHLDFCHECEFGLNTPEAYERLLSDVLHNDKTLFTSWTETHVSWKIVDPLLKRFAQGGITVSKYPAGSWGPPEADSLTKKEGRKWNIPKAYVIGGGAY